jgi:hypothetical protein
MHPLDCTAGIGIKFECIKLAHMYTLRTDTAHIAVLKITLAPPMKSYV